MAFRISEFKSALEFGGARPTLFQVQITNPISGAADLKMPFMIKTASLPAHTTGQITVSYFGRDIKHGGDRTYDSWNVTVINDEDFLVRNALEAWSNAINTHESNLRALPQDYKADGQVTQFAKNGDVLRTYTFQGLFPTSIDAIDLGWETKDTIEEFSVTFDYDKFDVDGGTTGTPLT